jgi:1-phosphofructokinase
MISLGAIGAVLACSEGLFIANAPQISALSTIGAGDSSIAGFLAAHKDGKSPAECLKNAVAFGSAACLTEGTKPPKKEDIEQLIQSIKVKKQA